MALNRNKRSLAIDLKSEDGLKTFYDLVAQSDVVLDNLRFGLRETLKIDHETLLRYNNQIISCSINGFGSNTPDCNKPAFDLIVQAKGGGISLTGELTGRPSGWSLHHGLCAGVYAVTGVLAALHERRRSKTGKKIEVPLMSTMISLLGYEATLYLYSGEIPGPVACGHRSLVPYNAVSTKDGHIVIGAHLPKFWSSLCEVLGIADVGTDPGSTPSRSGTKTGMNSSRFSTNAFPRELPGNGSRCSMPKGSPALPSTMSRPPSTIRPPRHWTWWSMWSTRGSASPSRPPGTPSVRLKRTAALPVAAAPRRAHPGDLAGYTPLSGRND